ncbi:hypothetical protein V8G54_031389 [Vigna mungo]|uniref:Uncharacterized protein n=1 Tax=Vigna mungo TaxID=3915 RepID=A0AAQ3RNT8_VIGMU
MSLSRTDPASRCSWDFLLPLFRLVQIHESWWHEEMTTTFWVGVRRRARRRPFLPCSWFVHAWKGSDFDSRRNLPLGGTVVAAKRLRDARGFHSSLILRLLAQVVGHAIWGLGMGSYFRCFNFFFVITSLR